jgi:hypothetical protein
LPRLIIFGGVFAGIYLLLDSIKKEEEMIDADFWMGTGWVIVFSIFGSQLIYGMIINKIFLFMYKYCCKA